MLESKILRDQIYPDHLQLNYHPMKHPINIYLNMETLLLSQLSPYEDRPYGLLMYVN